MLKLLGSLLFASGAAASYAGNLNYRSPSNNHPHLAVDVQRVNRRDIPSAGYSAEGLNFTHGVASGDPYPNSVILWTRCSPKEDNVDNNGTVSGTVPFYNPVLIYNSDGSHIPHSRAPVCLQYRVASDDKFNKVVDRGRVYTSSDVDYTVKVEAQNLKPFTTYYYQFVICGSDVGSPVGRTKTAPHAKDDVSQINLAVYSCSNYPFGFFNAYGNPAYKDSVDYVLHLGDYIYEYKNGHYGWGNSLNRIPQPDRDIFTLYDYRRRHGQYRTDGGLQASHKRFAWIPVWDDHEVSDNVYKDGSSGLQNDEQSFMAAGGVSIDQRKMNAVRAYFEWMPLRQVEMDDNLRIWRNFKLGKLLDVIMLDTRVYDRSITDIYTNTEYVGKLRDDAGRSLMGSRQENWFYRSLIESKQRGATWRVIGSQIVFSRLNQSESLGNDLPFNTDAWDGYTANRNRTLKTLYDNKIGNNIMLAGDSHANWVSDLAWIGEKPYDGSTGEGGIGVEFAGTAVSSPSPVGQNISIPDANKQSERLVADNSELQWNELYYRGYYELHITKKQVQAKYYGMPSLRTANANEISLANFTVVNGENRLSRANGGVGGGVVENGALKGGERKETNATVDVSDGRWFISPDHIDSI